MKDVVLDDLIEEDKKKKQLQFKRKGDVNLSHNIGSKCPWWEKIDQKRIHSSGINKWE